MLLRSANPPLWRESRMGLELATLMRDGIMRGEGMTDGQGQPVLLIPGFMAGDNSLGLMARASPIAFCCVETASGNRAAAA